MTTVHCQVTDGSGRPDVVHGPYHTLAAKQYLADVLQRQHALIDPVQMDNVGFLEFRQVGDVCATVGYVDIEQMVALQV